MRNDPCAPSATPKLVAAFGCLLAMTLVGQAQTKFKPHPDGFWKIHPPTNFKSEFGGEDPIGLANHQHIKTDCSIVWKNGQKFYCFSSQMSSQFVQENPGAYLPQAAAFWAKEHPKQSMDEKGDTNTVASDAHPAR